MPIAALVARNAGTLNSHTRAIRVPFERIFAPCTFKFNNVLVLLPNSTSDEKVPSTHRLVLTKLKELLNTTR
jgi:hypothetical protein